MTRYQIFQVYLRPEKEKEEGTPVYISAFELFWRHLHKHKIADTEIIERWKSKTEPKYHADAVIDPGWHQEHSNGENS